jgi:gliding motility-associated-like protein
MKTISAALYFVLQKSRAVTFLIHLRWLNKSSWVIFFFLFLSFDYLSAQDIVLKNPSLEGVRGQVKAPPGWLISMNTPDIQPGVLGITVPPSEGISYVGLHSGKDVLEGIAQEVNLKPQHTYSVSFDLAYVALYIYRACYGDLAIYGSDSPTEPAELLWRSGQFYHTDWKRYTAEFKTPRSFKYIILVAYVSGECNQSAYGCALLIDNLSTTIREVPQITLDVQYTCIGASNGSISAVITGITQSRTSKWKPGGQTTESITNLAKGTYEVTVTAANGTKATASAVIRDTDLKSEVSTIASNCYGENKNQIILKTKGGIPPYQYYLNEESHASYTPIFQDLKPGNYRVKVKDEHGCLESLENIKLIEPQPLKIAEVGITGTSCSSTVDGKIALNLTGGTTPYLYRLETSEWQSDSVLKQLSAGVYYYQIKDKNSCQVNGSAEVTKNIRECAVFVPTAFSPNGDGQNDLFRAKVHDDVHDYRLDVFTRWGQTVFSTNSPDGAWDGLFKGQMLPTATYVWVLLYTDSKQQARKQTGTVMLIH